MSPPSLGPMLVTVGLAVVVVGLLVWAGGFGWFGRLPGDIRIERESVHIYIPLVSMLAISIVFNVVFYLIRRLF